MGAAKSFTALGLTVAVFSGFGGLLIARAAGETVPPAAVAIAASLALVLGLALAGIMLVRIWRGPPLSGFLEDGVAFCEPGQAEVIRAAAEVRGTLGGAGHVHRARLVFPAIAWTAAASFAEGFITPGAEAPLWPLVVLVPAAAASLLWRPRSFHYREATGGWLVIHPGAALRWLVRESEAAGGRQPPAGAVLSGGSSARDG